MNRHFLSDRRDFLVDASLTYRLTLHAAQPESATTHFATHESWSIDGVESGAFGSTTERRGSPATKPELEFKGSAIPSGTDPEQFLTITPM